MSNLYYHYIEILKKKEKKGFPENSVIHKHHIEPKHTGGDPNGPLVYCTARDHARAHYIRYLVYNEKYDLCAYYGLVNKTFDFQKAITEKIIAINRERRNCMFNPIWQKEMANRPKSSFFFQQNPQFAAQIGKKGGQRGGKVMTEKKKEVLKQNGYKVGTNYGRIGGMKHQHLITKRRLSLYLEWVHDSEVTTISPPFETVKQLTQYLNYFVPGIYVSAVSQILRDCPSRRCGWQITRELEL